MRVPAALVAVPLLAGIACAVRLADSFGREPAFLCAAAALAVLVAAVASAMLDDPVASTCGMVLGGALCGLSLGATAIQDAYDAPLVQWFRTGRAEPQAVVEGVLREDAVRTPYGVVLTVDVTTVDGRRVRASPAGGIRLTVGGDLLGETVREWRAGRTIRAPAALREPSVYLNPGVPDERRALARRGIVLMGSVKSAILVQVVARGTRVSEASAAVRAWARARIAAYMAPLDERSAGVTTAVLIGDRTGLAREDERRMQDAGTYHVIAISGGNIAILAGVLLMAGRAMFVSARAASLLTGVVLLGYGAIVVGAPSVSRAITVAVLVLTARVLDHRGAALNALSMAAVLAVAASPLTVVDAGFVLSFGATLGILTGVPLVSGASPRVIARGPVLTWRYAAATVRALFAATLCAELALVPVAATLFGRVPMAGLLLNFAAVPLMTCVQTGGLAVLMTAAWWDWGARAAAAAAHLSAAGLLESARLVDVAPWVVADVGAPVGWLVVSYYVCALLIVLGWGRRAAVGGLALAVAAVLIPPHRALANRVTPHAVPLRITVLDVGQADATLVQLPGGHALLVDAGGVSWAGTGAGGSAFDLGERVVARAIRALGTGRLHGLVLTHGDPDHVQGAPGLLRRVDARSIWEGVPVPPDEGLQSLAALAAAHRMSWRTVQAGDVERFGDAEVRVLHPPLPDWERQRVRNDDSVVLDIRIGNVSVVLPGDIGQEGERTVLHRLEPGRLVVLKAPHHGSATSSTPEFLERLRPAAVIFSCGRGNRFGHPHPAVVARYRALGTEIFSTAEDGAVVVETDGTTVDVRGWTGTVRRFGR